MYERGSTNHLPDPELSAAPTPPAETPPPVLREPTEEEILEGVMCRFCFDSGSDEGRLIAPCACSGSQTWVHEVCLRKWQKAKAYSSRGGPRHDAVCNVCMTPFALPPPPPPPLPTVRAGSFLVAAPSLSGIFHQTVILMCEVDAHGAHGVIINRPTTQPGASRARPHDEEPRDEVEKITRELQARGMGQMQVGWQRGGPVCGGRLGVVNYTVLHSLSGLAPFPSTIVVTGSSSTEGGADGRAEGGAEGSASGEGGMASCASVLVVCEPRGNIPPASLSRTDLLKLMAKMAQQAVEAPSLTGQVLRAIVCTGHCSWARGQLQNEIARGSWQVCDATAEEIYDSGEDLWERLRASGRLTALCDDLDDDDY